MKENFFDLEINSNIVALLHKNGITEPTPIQAQVIPELMKGKDVIGQAQTGTGKTLAFVLPIFERIDLKEPHIQALIVTPTRELAIQITTEAKKLAEAKGITILAAYGGQDVDQQIKRLKGTIHMVIGTPGRLLDHLRRKTIDIGKLKMLVLDEADQMLHMGFLNEVETIIHQTPQNRQTMFFSATMPSEIRSLATQYMNKPTQIQVQGKDITLREIKQLVIETSDRGKQNALLKALEEYQPFMAIIFCRTKRRAKALNEALQLHGYQSDELHGDLTQAKREKVMKAFRNTKLQLLVATDVAARGLDIDGVTHVFNYDIPQDTESYIHRIGRTGRAGDQGVAITLVAPKDRGTLMLIEREIKMTLEKRRITGEEINSNDLSEERDTRKSRLGGSRPKDHRQQGKSKNEKNNKKRPQRKEKSPGHKGPQGKKTENQTPREKGKGRAFSGNSGKQKHKNSFSKGKR